MPMSLPAPPPPTPLKYMQAREHVTCTFSFEDKLQPGDLLVPASVTIVSDLDFTQPQVVDGLRVTTRLSGGTTGLSYLTTCLASTTSAEVLALSVNVLVREDVNSAATPPVVGQRLAPVRERA
jgi:hypothetical protein